jgi:hypothetical protein
MKVNALTFFNFCATHVPLLRELTLQPGEISEADTRRLIRSSSVPGDELPETAWRRLNELQILVPAEPGSDFYFLADAVARLLAYLFDEAKAATPEIIRGYIQSLDSLCPQLSRAIDGDDITVVRLALEELQQTLRRIHADLEETHRSILIEVGRYKTERQSISVRDKYRRIVHWMERYVDPMVDIVRPDGPLRASFDESERLMHRAREYGLFNDLPALERNLRHLRLVQRHALRVFQQCRRELQPLYESLRRASFIAEGAALALDRLQREGVDGWVAPHAIPALSLRWQYVPSDAAIERALRAVIEHPPAQAPVLALNSEETAPVAYLRHLWLEGLSTEVRPTLPVTDLLGWMVREHPRRDTADVLAGFTRLIFDPEFSARFSDHSPVAYETADGQLEASPVELIAS